MIVPLLLATSLLATPVKDTVWWNTQGGKVLEHRDRAGVTCSLSLYSDARSVTFTWVEPGGLLVTARDPDWQFPENRTMPAAIQVGGQWVGNRSGPAIMQAIGHGAAVNFALDAPIDTLLHAADHIAIRMPGEALSIPLNEAKMPQLLGQLQRCRDVAKR